MSSSQAVRTSKYSYRATSSGPGGADINIEYSADLSNLSRLEVRPHKKKIKEKLLRKQEMNPRLNVAGV